MRSGPSDDEAMRIALCQTAELRRGRVRAPAWHIVHIYIVDTDVVLGGVQRCGQESAPAARQGLGAGREVTESDDG